MTPCAAPVQEVYYFEANDRPSKCAVIIHPPKKEGAAYYATMMTPYDDNFVDLFKPDLARDKVTTMTKTQKGIVKKGEETVREQDKAMWMAIRGMTTRKIRLAVTTATVAFRQAAGHMTKVIDPGVKGRLIDREWLEDAKNYINEHSPGYIYTHIPYDHDDEPTTGGAKEWTNILQEQVMSGVTSMIADTHFACRWDQQEQEVTHCKGDLAFATNSSSLGQRVEEWSKANEHGNQRSTDDIVESEFVDVMTDWMVQDHMDKSMASAFVGTEEDNEELSAWTEKGSSPSSSSSIPR